MINNDEEHPPVLVTGWGFGPGDYVEVKQSEAYELNQKPVDVRWQQTGPREGVWVLAENWQEYTGPTEEIDQ